MKKFILSNINVEKKHTYINKNTPYAADLTQKINEHVKEGILG